MKKFFVFLFLSLFISQNVYADSKVIGRCIGYLITKMQNEGQSSISKSNLNWMKKHRSEINVVTKISNEQKNCIVPGQPFKHCLSGYTNYEGQLYIEMNHGISQYNQNRYNEAKRALFEMACSENF
ncbi:MAG: hypothetical protein H8E55_69075 [Pelagibacterales bacterium]|nr:hypothetical protein [Pelagibacterales bacterium]